jgi:LDH2 family malate/lactate/ureidoglycolate dehydrogenase
MPRADARLTVLHSMEAEVQGNVTHGLSLILKRVRQFAAGELNPRTNVATIRNDTVFTVDGDRGVGCVVMSRALEAALACSDAHPLLLCVVHRVGLLGALGAYGRIAAERGAIAFVMQRTRPIMSLSGTPAIGNNPLAFSAPLPGRAPLVFDMACCIAARMKVELAATESRAIPAGWALDQDGQPTTDAKAALAGALLPLGDHKGMGLAMMVECLTRGLADDRHAADYDDTAIVSAAALILNPSAIVGKEAFGARMDEWTSRFTAAVEGSSARLPGAHAPAMLERARLDGVRLSATTIAALFEAASMVGVSIDLGAAARMPASF